MFRGSFFNKILFTSALTFIGIILPVYGQEIIKLGLSVPLSGAAAVWGKGSEWMCNQAAQEIAQHGGVKVSGKVYNFACIAYDNKYNAAEGTKVAQALLNRDGVKFIGGSIGTAPVMALQSLTERTGVLLFTSAFGTNIKGPKFPLTFTTMNTGTEIAFPLTAYVKKTYPNFKTVAILSPNDATGQDVEVILKKAWSAVGVKVITSDWYDRGTTEFQPIAAKMVAAKVDAVDFGAMPPADAGLALKELTALGWKGIKVITAGSGSEGLVAAGGSATEGSYMGFAMQFDSPRTTEKQRRLNDGARAATGESLNAVQIGFYDAVIALKSAMEYSQSIDPLIVAKALSKITFESFYGPSGFGGTETYGSPQQILVPVYVTQIQNGKLVEVERIESAEMKIRNK